MGSTLSIHVVLLCLFLYLQYIVSYSFWAATRATLCAQLHVSQLRHPLAASLSVDRPTASPTAHQRT